MCTRFGPVVERISKEKEKVLFLIVDVDKSPTIQKELKSKAMPTFVFFLDGKEFSRIDGASEQMLQNYTETLLLQKQPSFMENGILHIVKEKDFNESLKNHANCVVDFYADWCQPCKMIAPSYEELAKNTTDVLFMKVNVDNLRNVMTKCRVTCMPTFCVFKDGKMKEKIEGGSMQLLKKAIDDFKLSTVEYTKRDLMAAEAEIKGSASKSGTEKNKATMSPKTSSTGKKANPTIAQPPTKSAHQVSSSSSTKKSTTSSTHSNNNPPKMDASPQKPKVVKKEASSNSTPPRASQNILTSPYLSSVPPFRSPHKEQKVKKQKSPYLN